MKLRKKNKRLDDSGMALVLVIVAIALVTLLVTVLLSVSLTNYQMKTTEIKSKDNFYSAEMVMDQIHAGLQQVVSEAADKAYLQAVQKYKVSYITEQERAQAFKNTYITEVKRALQIAGDDKNYLIGGPEAGYVRDEGLYQEGLAAFLDKELAERVEKGLLKIEYSGSGDSMVQTEDGLLLRKLCVKYTDDEGYYSEIETDICMGFPNLALEEISVLPNVFDYAFIAKDSLVFDNVNGATVNHSVYAGKQGIVLNGSRNVCFEDVKYLVTKGDIIVNNNSSLEVSGENIFAQGIQVNGSTVKGTSPDSSTLSLHGNVYVADDLTMNNWNVSAELNGSYYGYGGENGIEEQSAILLNGGNSVLDMSGLDNLLLCGNAYINGKAVSVEERMEESGGVMLGTSVAMKTDQIAFLAPAECLGTSDGKTVIGKNPMTEAEYNEWLGMTGEKEQLFDVTVPTRLLQEPLSDYGLSENSYRTVFRTVKGETICYVYLNFSNAEDADRYYREYMSAAGQRMQEYMSRYDNEVKFDQSATNLLAKGNLLTYNVFEEQMSIVNNTISSAMTSVERQDLQNRQKEYADTYKAMCSKLTTDYAALDTTEFERDVYENLIDQTVINNLATEKKYTVDGSVAVVAKNHSAMEVGDASHNPSYKLVIAAGDVTVKGNFSGLIIAGGKVTVDAYTGVTISSDKETVTRLLQASVPEEEGGKTVIATYFVNGDRYSFDGARQESAYVDLGNLITYVNWTQK